MNEEHWLRLCQLLDDGPLVVEAVRLAVSSPEAYFAAHEDALLQRGIEDAAEVDGWLALIDALDAEGALAYLDWKDTGAELADALSAVPRVVSRRISLDTIADVEGGLEPALAYADTVLAPHGLRLVYLDEDSDAYPLVVVPATRVDEIIALASQLEHTARVFI